MFPKLRGKMFPKLRGKLNEFDIDQAYLGQKLRLSRATVCAKMTGSSEWSLAEMYIIMDLIQAPYEQLHEYFPKDGGATRRKVS